MDNPCVVDHPLVQHKLGILRNRETGSKEFREIVSELASFLCYEATRNLPLRDTEVETPIARAKTKALSGKKMAAVPILRAGLGMVEGILNLVPSAKVGHVGLYRDPDTLDPVPYYCKLPPDISDRVIFVLDPMLATGGSASDAISQIKKAGGVHIKLLNILATPAGIAKVRAAHPDVEMFVCCIDESLNDIGFIVPGLGDAGDRIFGTK